MVLKDKINQVLPNYFNVMPKADYVVKPVESFREQSAAGASYESPAVDVQSSRRVLYQHL